VYIDPSLARGIRRSYLLALDEAWVQWHHAQEVWRRREPVIRMPHAKSFNKRCRREESLARRFLPVDGVTLSSGRRRIWATLSLRRECCNKPGNPWGMSEAGFGRVVAQVLSYPAGFQDVRVKIRFSGHAIDRVIQRAGVVNLPLQGADIEAIHASFAGALIWSCAALNVLASEPRQPTAGDLCIALPVDHGLFLAVRDDLLDELVILSFIPSDRLWDEERYALARLRRVGDEGAAVLAGGVLCPELFRGDAPQEWRIQIVQAWRELRWLLREKPGRPGALGG